MFLEKSGGAQEPLVVGLVVAQFRHTENLETFSGKQTIHHPLGLSTVAHAEAIRQTLKKAAE